MTTLKHKLIRQHIDSFPVLPANVARLMKVTNDPESSARDVVEVILPDQSLCLTVLKIANSVLFGCPQKVDSIKTAVAVLGFDEVQRIALTKALVNSFNKLADQYKISIDRYWEHSFISGTAARIIAKDLNIAPDIAYMGGLFHDIGKLIMLETFSDEYDHEYWMTIFSNKKIIKAELQKFSFTHDKIGGQLLKKWSFPQNLTAAVANHHNPDDADEEKKLANIIQLADLLSFYCCNQDFLEDEDILTATCKALPDIKDQWQKLGLPLQNNNVTRWYGSLLESHEQVLDLKKAFN